MRGPWIPGLLLLAAACAGGETDGAGESVVRDSAGIAIVENTGGSWGSGEGWTIGAEPELQLGGDPTDPVKDFNQVTGALILSNGTLAVANSSSSEVRFFDAEGNHLQTSGRQGAGPGEYAAIAGLWRTPTDSLVVLDIMVRRMTVLGPDGGVGRSFSLGGLGGQMIPDASGTVSMSFPAGMLDDGSLIGVSLAFGINATREGTFRDSIPAIRFGPDGAVVDTVSWFPGLEMEQMTLNFGGQSVSTPTGVPLGKNTIVVATGAQAYVATNNAWEVQVWRPGTGLSTIIRLDRPARALAPEGVARHREDQIQLMDAQAGANLPPQLRDQMVERINSVAYPATLPFIASILVDDSGHIWVQEQDQPGDRAPHFAVFDPSGRMLGSLDMAERFRPTQIRGNQVIGIWQDDDDVEYVRVYRLNRGGE